MCELAILDPRNYTAEVLAQNAMAVYRTQGDSLGVVFVMEKDDQTAFEYGVYKSINPDVNNIEEFMSEHMDTSIRVIIHGRLATHGDVTHENAHPIEIDCNQCNVDMVMHNGIVTRWRQFRQEHESEGHNYETNVDTESIAHEFGGVPRSVETYTDNFPVDEFQREPAYVLLNEDRVYVSSGRGYQLADDGRMCRRRNFGPQLNEKNYTNVVLMPSSHA